jgi:hypothetical protein
VPETFRSRFPLLLQSVSQLHSTFDRRRRYTRLYAEFLRVGLILRGRNDRLSRLPRAILSPKLGTWAIESTSLKPRKEADLPARPSLGVGGETARAIAARFQPLVARPAPPREEPQNRGSPIPAMTAQSPSLSVFSRLSCRENREWRDGGGHSPQDNGAPCRSETMAPLAPRAPGTRPCPAPAVVRVLGCRGSRWPTTKLRLATSSLTLS